VKNFKIPVYLTIGGWAKSSHFPTVTKDRASRGPFIKKAKSIVKKYGLAGIDYDWEHPKGKAEEAAYGALIKETSEAGVKVTVAAAGWQKFDASVFKFIERINLMSYDHEKEHATLEKSKKDVESFIKMGCPVEKICLGVPFYGRHVEKRGAKSYVTFASKLKSTDEDLYEGYYFNNQKILIEKAVFVKEKKLAGIMIWEIEQDDSTSTLLKTIREELLPEKN
jgi:GH18 family chitinase